MAELAACMEEAGCRSVSTYIQSGNAVFLADPTHQRQAHDHEASPWRLMAEAIEDRIERRAGFRPPVLVLSIDEVAAAMRGNPYSDRVQDPRNLHLGFLWEHPRNPRLEKMDELTAPDEGYSIIDRVFYLHAPSGFGRSKLAAAYERLLGVPVTDRNWRTMCRVHDMALALAGRRD